LTAYLVWFGYLERGSILLTVGLTIAFFLLFIVSLIDLEKMLVPDGYVVAAGVIGGMTMIITHQNTWLEILLGLVIGAGSIAAIIGIWWLLFRQWGMGEGDIWIAGAIGLIVGYPTILIALFSSVVIGAVLGSLALMMSSWMKGESIQGAQCMKKAIPFGPFLFMGGLIALQWGHSIISWYILW
jgi:leader peptidase (prepilin peptidase)/N-methyltransferase